MEVTDATGPAPEEPEDQGSAAGTLLRGGAAQTTLAVGLWLLLMVSLVVITSEQAIWLRPFARDFVKWASHPGIAGPVYGVPPGLAVGVLMALAYITIGWFGSALLLAATPFEESFSIRIGLALVLGLSFAGYTGMLGLVLGQLDRTLIGIVIAIALGGVVAGTLAMRRARAALLPRPNFQRPRLLAVVCIVIAAGVTCGVGVHAALSPVTEWDALIYHAGAAKLWFLEAPRPPLLYGPSVGIEISGNYPPLFPAIGAVFDVAIGSFQDVYLRLVSPVLLAATLFLVYGYASRRIGSSGPSIAIALSIGAPLIVLYGTWPTGYAMLTTLWLAAVIVGDGAASSGSLRLWTLAGILSGLAIVTHFYGLPSLAVGPLALAFGKHTRRNLWGALAFVIVACITASPWLVRNAVLLNDPLYPLAIPFFHPIGLTEPLWSASEAEIQNNALGQWDFSSTPLFMAQAETILFQRHLLPAGQLFGILIAFWLALRGDRWAGYVLAVALAFIATLVAPGWFWMRALIPILPLVALLTARGLVSLREYFSSRNKGGQVGMGMMRMAEVAILVASAITAVSLAVAGPNQDTWTTLLDGTQNDMMAGVRNLGSDPASLYNAFAGDYEAWAWLDSKIPAGERVASLDNRLYYFDRPQDLFYLDGIEASALAHISSATDARSFLAQRNVRFVLVPGWASSSGPTHHPAVDEMPIFQMLGHDTNFPVAAIFPDNYPEPTVIYAVAPYLETVKPAVYLGRRVALPPTPDGPFTLARGDTSPRIMAAPINARPTILRFEYQLGSGASLSVNEWDHDRQSWIYGVYGSSPAESDGVWHSAFIPLRTMQGYVVFGLFAAAADITIRNVALENPVQPLVDPGNGQDLGSGVFVLSGNDGSNRLIVPQATQGVELLGLEYRASGAGYFDLNYRDPASSSWRTIQSPRFQKSLGWSTIATELARGGPFVEYAIFVSGADLEIRGLSLSRQPVIESPVPHDPGTPYVFPARDTSGRILIPVETGQVTTLTLTYRDSPGAFALNVLDPYRGTSWLYGGTIVRSGRGAWMTTSLLLPAGPGRVVEVGPIAYRGDFVVRDVSTDSQGPAA